MIYWLGEERWKRFLAALNGPAEPIPALVELFKGDWERDDAGNLIWVGGEPPEEIDAE